MPRCCQLRTDRSTRRRDLRAVAVLALIAIALGWATPPAGAAPRSSPAIRSRLSASAVLSLPARALVDAHHQRMAEHRARYLAPLFFAWAGVQIAALFAFWASGLAARLRRWLSARVVRPPLERFALGAAASGVASLAASPVGYARYRLDTAFGVSSESQLGWLHDVAIAAAVDALVVGAIVAAVYTLVERTKLWYLYAIVGIGAATLALAFVEPIVVAPLYNRIVPLSAHAPVRASLDALARRVGIVGAPLYRADFSRRSRSYVADIAGFGPTKRIVLGDSLLRDGTKAEIVFLTAREFGHYVHGDDFRLSFVWTALFVAATAIAVALADRVPFRRDDDALVRLPLVLAVLGVVGLLLAPAYDAYSRNLEARADAYALAVTRDRAAAVRAFVRIDEATLVPLCPSRFARAYFLTSPPLGARIAKVQRRPDPCRATAR